MSQQQENNRDPIEEEHTAMPEDDEDNDGESILADQRDNARLANRLQYYQQYAQRNHPDNPNSSDEEDNTRHLERGSMESKSRENEENEDDMNDDDDDNLLNEYAPLGGETQTFEYEEETEEFGDFVSSSISEIRLEQIDAMLNTDNLEALEKNSLFSRITRESHRYVDNQNNEISSVTVEEETISVGDVPEPAEEAHHQKASVENNHNNNNKPPVPPQEFRSIPPLTKEKVDMIKGIMANMKIKPPKNVATLQLLETVDKQIFRLGDEFPSTLEK